MNQYEDTTELSRGMKSRHLAMIAIGGTISASFFLGLGDVLHSVGPFGTVLAFAIGGLVMFLALLSLAEMAVAMPISGSFQAYATKFISPLAGFLTGWLYILNFATASAASLTAASMIMHHFYSSVAPWEWSIVFMLIICGLNLFPVKIYGEFEFWFAGIKIFAIIIFILVGAGLIFGIIPHNIKFNDFANFTKDGLFPTGFIPFLYALVVVVCTYQGAELVGIAAGESEDPENNIKKAIKNVGVRILLFFVISVFIVAMIMPWQEATVAESPFSVVFKMAHIPYVSTIMQIVIITSSLSAVNSVFYACARLLWSMAKTKQAPQIFSKTNKHNSPIYGVFFTCLLSAVCLLSKFVGAEKIFMMIIASSGMIGCIIWIMISWSHIGFRKHLRTNNIAPSTLKFQVKPYPLIPLLSIVANLLVIAGMLFDSSQRIVIYAGLGILIFFSLIFFITQKRQVNEN